MTNTQPYQGKAGNATTSNSWNSIDISGFPSFNLYGNPGPAPHGMGLLTQCTAKISGTVGFALGAAAQVIGNVQKFGPAAAAIASKYVGGSAAWGNFFAGSCNRDDACRVAYSSFVPRGVRINLVDHSKMHAGWEF